MMSNRTQVLGVFSRLIIYMLGIFSFIYVFRVLNVKNAIIGYFYTEPDVVKISDFEYDFKSLLFTNSGVSDNEYFARVNAKPVSNFDKTKKYTVTINGIQANRVYGDYTYINSNFTNNFISTQDTTLLTDTLNIKINFYTEETIIVFTTQSGEKAVSLWSSYIAKNGFVLKIVEDNYTPQIEADNLIEYTSNLYIDNKIVKTYTYTAISQRELPKVINNKHISSWVDSEGNKYTEFPFKNIDLYGTVEYVMLNFVFDSNNAVVFDSYSSVNYISTGSLDVKQEDKESFDLIFDKTTSKTGKVVVSDFYGLNFNLNISENNYEKYYTRTSIFEEFNFSFKPFSDDDSCIINFTARYYTDNLKYFLGFSVQTGNSKDKLQEFFSDMNNKVIPFKVEFNIKV